MTAPPTMRFKRGDTGILQYQLLTYDLDGKRLTPVDLTNQTVKFNMQPLEIGEFPSVEGGDCEILDEELAIVGYAWGAGETDVIGFYGISWSVTDDDTGEVVTYPQEGPQRLFITPEI